MGFKKDFACWLISMIVSNVVRTRWKTKTTMDLKQLGGVKWSGYMAGTYFLLKMKLSTF